MCNFKIFNQVNKNFEKDYLFMISNYKSRMQYRTEWPEGLNFTIKV